MALLLGGLFSLVSFMLLVMGIPLVMYLRRERRWEKAGKPREAWYNPSSDF